MRLRLRMKGPPNRKSNIIIWIDEVKYLTVSELILYALSIYNYNGVANLYIDGYYLPTNSAIKGTVRDDDIIE